MDKLKADLIKKSTKKGTSKSTKSTKKLQKIYRVALNQRGGQIDDILNPADLESKFSLEFTLAQRIQQMFLKALVFLKSREENADKLRLIFLAARLGIDLILIRCNISVEYFTVNGITQKVGAIATCTGGTLGFVYGWFTAGISLAVPPTILSAFMIRSLIQQYMNNKNHQQVIEFYQQLATDSEFRERILQSIKQQHKQFIENYQKIHIENLNWNANPEIKQAAERLGIFEDPPRFSETLHLDTLDFDLELEQMLDNLGLLKKPKSYSTEELNEFIKSKLESRGEFNVFKIREKTLSSENEIDIS